MLADLVLAVHFCIAAFITAGFALIPLGAAAGWRWIRHRRLRLFHAGAIAFVALESLAGIACPLTVWEAMLRGGTSGSMALAADSASGAVTRQRAGDMLPYELGSVVAA
mgnify:CR=1 FL=1